MFSLDANVYCSGIFFKSHFQRHCVLGHKIPLVAGFYVALRGEEGHNRTREPSRVLWSLRCQRARSEVPGSWPPPEALGYFEAAFHSCWTVAPHGLGDGSDAISQKKTSEGLVLYS